MKKPVELFSASELENIFSTNMMKKVEKEHNLKEEMKQKEKERSHKNTENNEKVRTKHDPF